MRSSWAFVGVLLLAVFAFTIGCAVSDGAGADNGGQDASSSESSTPDAAVADSSSSDTSSGPVVGGDATTADAGSDAATCAYDAGPGAGKTITVGPNDCSSDAVNAAIAGADPGATIELSCTGTVTWSTPVTLSGGKTLKGPGMKGATGDQGTWPLVIELKSTGQQGVDVSCDENQAANRLTGLKFTGGGPDMNWALFVEGRGVGPCGYGAFRVDNNDFTQIKVGSRLIQTDGTTGKLTGVFDHNVIAEASPSYNLIAYQNSYKGTSATCYGWDALQRANAASGDFGGDDFVFYEDNYFFNVGLETGGAGSKVVVRHNVFASDFTDNSFCVLDGHGTDTGGWHSDGIVANEFYENTVTGANANAQLTYVRGGKWLVYNNKVESGAIEITEYRAAGTPDCQVLEWNACAGQACCTPACKQCPTDADFAGCYPLPNQVHDTFMWNNIHNGENMVPWLFGTYTSTYIALNRDYWMPPYGPAAARPSTCEAGTYYGDSDDGKLWKCSTTNTWTLKYAPYPYPHPLP